jgi:hypothetical protein
VPTSRIEEAEMARASTRTVNRGENAASMERQRAVAPSVRADATDAPERAAVKRPASAVPAGSIAAIELMLGF